MGRWIRALREETEGFFTPDAAPASRALHPFGVPLPIRQGANGEETSGAVRLL